MADSLRLALTREAPMHKLTVVSTLVLFVFLVTACDDAKNTVAAPTSFDAAGVSASVTAGSAIADPNAGGSCAAFTIPLAVSVAAGLAAVEITNVTARFVDRRGISMPQVTLPAPVPTAQVGSDLIAARSVRTIPLMLPIGCLVDRAGTVVVVLTTRDRRGRGNTTEVSTNVPGPNAPGTGTPGTSGGGPNVPR